MISHYLSFDFGASSGRAFVTTLANGSLLLDEVHRFSNETITENNILFWNFNSILENVKSGIKIAFAKYPLIKSIGIDTWGVDYGLIGKDGKLLRNPVCYRDLRTNEILDDFDILVDKEDLYRNTGIQYMAFNTIYQLFHDVVKSKELISITETMLLMPDLIAYYLTGEKRIEVTNLSTTNFYNPYSNEIIPHIKTLGIPGDIIPKLINPGEVYGKIKKDVCEELNIPQIPVIAVCSHDTASAILSIPSTDRNVYISAGTWSLCGTLLNNPITNSIAMSENYTNELGYDNKVRFLKNIMGLWIVNKCREEWANQGFEYSNSLIEELILVAEPFLSYIDPDDPMFVDGNNIPEKIRTFCRETNQIIPITNGEVLRCVYQSLAFKYRYVIERLEKIVNNKFDTIVIVGGGGQIELLNQMTASLCNKMVKVGPKEATVIGNSLILMLQDRKIKSIEDGKKMISNNIGYKIFQPLLSDEYEKYYTVYCALMARGG